MEVLKGKRVVHAHSYRADEILMLMRLADELGFHVTTFQHVLEGYRVADEMAAHGASGSTFSDWWSFKMEAFEAIPYNAAIMTQRGVLTSLNSDDANLARRLNLEAAKTIHYGGMTREQAFAMVTINPARQLKIDDHVGSLAAGKDADVVIWSGDPLSVYTGADMTFVDGKLRFSRERRHRAPRHRDGGAGAARRRAQGRGCQDCTGRTAGRKAGARGQSAGAEIRVSLRAGRRPRRAGGDRRRHGAHAGRPRDCGRRRRLPGRPDHRGRRTPDTPVPAGAERIDASGKHLWPGLIHTNTVLGISEIDTVAGSVDVTETGDINADADVSQAVNAASTHFPVARSAGITHAVVVPSGGMVAGTTTFLRTDGWTWEEMSAVRRHSLVLRWPDPIPPAVRRLPGPFEDPRRAQEGFRRARQDARQADGQRRGLRPRQAEAGQRSGAKWEYDAQLEALQPVLSGERPLWVNAREKHAIEAVVNWAAKRKLRLVITDGRDAYLVDGPAGGASGTRGPHEHRGRRAARR